MYKKTLLYKNLGMNSNTNRTSPLADSNITDVGNLVIIKKVGKGSSLKVIKFQDKVGFWISAQLTQAIAA